MMIKGEFGDEWTTEQEARDSGDAYIIGKSNMIVHRIHTDSRTGNFYPIFFMTVAL